ncbi:2'-5' RNA ligase family protein [bacterium]|nr:2'-5' RNA ligase family protein [bacterium]
MTAFERPGLDEVRAFYDTGANTGLIVPVPAAESVVGPLRFETDPSAAFGVGAHVTVLFPFVPRETLDREVEDAVARIAADHEPFDVTFGEIGRFPDVVWVAPDPAAPFRALTRSVSQRWPEHPPYRGEFDEPIPHLTVGHGDEGDLDRLAGAVGPGLPIQSRVDVIELLVFDGEWWRLRRRFPLGT